MYVMGQLLKAMGGARCVFWDPKKGCNRYVSKSKTPTGDRHGGIDYVNCKDLEKAQI